MSENTARGVPARQIDIPGLWVTVRGVQILLIVIFAKQVYLVRGTNEFRESLISAILFLVFVSAYFHPIATGTAETSGVRYRRYLRHKTVPWSDIRDIRWSGFRLFIRMKRKWWSMSSLVFLMHPVKAKMAHVANRLGDDTVWPEVVEHIQSLPVETPPIFSAPPLSRFTVRLLLFVVALLVLVMLMRLVLA